MKIITCISFYGSGSSAITDFISEFKNVKSLTNYEFRFLYDPDGISELEYNLVENFNKHNSGHALKRYKKLVDYYGNHLFVKRYEPFFNNQWKKISYQYIDSLTDFSYPGIWQYDFYDEGAWYEFWHKLPERIMHLTIWKNSQEKHIFWGNKLMLASHPTSQKFLQCTKEYTSKLMKEANKENFPYLMVDQILPSSNIDRHMRYFDNIKAIIVDRDPRDVYLLAKYEWHDTIVPRDLNTFCLWFSYVRSNKKTEKLDKNKIMSIQFEDLIYKYEETAKKIMNWLGLKNIDHNQQRKIFNPDNSIKNTRYWVQHPKYKKEADEIAKKLPEYLYKVDEK